MHRPSTPPAPQWWLCPNEPRCGHGSVLHDIEDLEDPSPTCCVDGCGCGHASRVDRVDASPAVGVTGG